MNNDQVHKSIDRLDRRISTLTDKVAELKKTVYQMRTIWEETTQMKKLLLIRMER
jgi:flagellar biosynthesis chaperone FliJ